MRNLKLESNRENEIRKCHYYHTNQMFLGKNSKILRARDNMISDEANPYVCCLTEHSKKLKITNLFHF